jgi:hypothetical protein
MGVNMKSFIRFILYCLIIASALSVTGLAQTSPAEKTEDIILLNNGATLKGRITENVENKKVTLVRADGVEFEISYKKIYAITDQISYDSVRAEFDARPKPKKTFTRPEIITMAGLLLIDSKSYLSLSAIGGYYFGKDSFLGLGLAMDDPENGSLVIMGELAYYRNIGNLKWYIYGNGGPAIESDNDESDFGGARLGTGLGLRIPWGKTPLTVRLGYRIYTGNKSDSIDGISVMAGFII